MDKMHNDGKHRIIPTPKDFGQMRAYDPYCTLLKK